MSIQIGDHVKVLSSNYHGVIGKVVNVHLMKMPPAVGYELNNSFCAEFEVEITPRDHVNLLEKDIEKVEPIDPNSTLLKDHYIYTYNDSQLQELELIADSQGLCNVPGNGSVLRATGSRFWGKMNPLSISQADYYITTSAENFLIKYKNTLLEQMTNELPPPAEERVGLWNASDDNDSTQVTLTLDPNVTKKLMILCIEENISPNEMIIKLIKGDDNYNDDGGD